MLNLLIAATVSYQITSGLPLRHDGYVVERTGSGENAEFVVKAGTKRAFLYANYESNRWMKAESYPFVRDPHFRMRALNVSRTRERAACGLDRRDRRERRLFEARQAGREDAQGMRGARGSGVCVHLRMRRREVEPQKIRRVRSGASVREGRDAPSFLGEGHDVSERPRYARVLH